MANSLSDQLLKAGLVNKQKAQQAKKQKQKSQKLARKGQVTEDQADKERLAAERAAQVDRDRQLNKQLIEQQRQKEYLAQVRQLLQQHEIIIENGDIRYNYKEAGGNKIKSIYVTELQQTQLSKGLIAISTDQERQYLVPRIIAEKAEQRVKSSLVFLASNESQDLDDDDPYKDYQIPDDLMW